MKRSTLLAALGCLLFVWAGASSAATEVQARISLQREVADLLRHDDFPALERRYAVALASRERFPSGVFISNQIIRSLADALQPRSGQLVTGNNPDLRKMADEFWKSAEDKAARWAKSSPDSSFAAIVQSEFLLQHAEIYRRNAYATSSAQADLEEFAVHVEKARSALEATRQAGSKDPGWYYEMLGVARWQGWKPDRFFELFQQAIEVDPYYYDTYFAASEFVMPQWGGSVDTLESFARFAASHTGAEEGASLYARIYWNAAAYFGSQLFQATRVDWPRMRKGFDDMVRRYPDALNLNAFALFACKRGDKATTRRVLLRIGEQIEPAIWQSRKIFSRCRLWANQPAGK